MVWRHTPPDKAIAESNRRGYDTNRGTPIKVGNVLYYGSPYNILCAVDAQSGRELWTFDPGVWREGVGFVGNLRGIAYWSDGEVERIFFGTASDKLFSVDARTGQPDPDFGEGGYVELLQGSDRPVNPDMTGVTSPPIVCDGVVVVGSAMNDWRFRSPPAYTPPVTCAALMRAREKCAGSFTRYRARASTVPRRGRTEPTSTLGLPTYGLR